MTTLREFTKRHLSLETDTKPIWKKSFPLSLRVHNKRVGYSFWFGDKYKEVLEEKFIRIHKGDIIDVEWHEVKYENDVPEER